MALADRQLMVGSDNRLEAITGGRKADNRLSRADMKTLTDIRTSDSRLS